MNFHIFPPGRQPVPLLTTAPRFPARSACSRRGHSPPLRRKCRGLPAGLFFRPARLTVPLLTTAPRFLSRSALFATRSLFPPAGNAAGPRPACFPACAAHCAAAHDGSALLCCHAARPPRRATARPSAKNTLRLRRNCFFACGSRCFATTGAPRFCVGAALVAARGRVWAPSLHFLPSHMAAAPLAPTPHATQGADIHSIHRA